MKHQHIYKGNIVYSADINEIKVHENSYILVEDGYVKEIFPVLPQQYKDIEIVDWTGSLIIPGFSDLHIHAPQYNLRGNGMDMLLFDWLDYYTFPEESQFANIEYAKAVYDKLVEDMLRHGTLHASMFTSIHYDASSYLFRRMEELGMYGYVGKTNMNMNSPDFLSETTEDALRETERFVVEHRGGKTVAPILTPRYAPTCSEDLFVGLGKIAKKYQVPVQTHLVESIAEVEFVKEHYPQYESDTDIYLKNGLMGESLTIFAHTIFPTQKELDTIKSHNAIAVHCPSATINVTAGIMPVGKFLDYGLPIAIGTDVGAGTHMGIYQQIATAIQFSKIKTLYQPEDNRNINLANAFYMATKGGGSCFDRVGSLEAGYRFNALVIKQDNDVGKNRTPLEQLERFCCFGDDRNIITRYIDGKEIVLPQ